MNSKAKISIKEIANELGAPFTVDMVRKNELAWEIKQFRIRVNSRVVFYWKEKVIAKLKEKGLL